MAADLLFHGEINRCSDLIIYSFCVAETYLHLAKISFLLITTLVFCRNSIRCCGKSLKHSSTIFCVLPHFSTWARGGGGFWSVSFRECTRVNKSTKRKQRGTNAFAISIINRIRLLLVAISLCEFQPNWVRFEAKAGCPRSSPATEELKGFARFSVYL